MNPRQFQQHIHDYPDFPKPGITFRDISPVLANPEAFAAALNAMAKQVDVHAIDKILGIDARGFIFASTLAQQLGKGLILARKPTKLPGELATRSYGYEYATSSLSIQRAAVTKSDRILVVDDVLATGNTAIAACKLIHDLGGTVPQVLFFVELAYLDGRSHLSKTLPDSTLITSVVPLDT